MLERNREKMGRGGEGREKKKGVGKLRNGEIYLICAL